MAITAEQVKKLRDLTGVGMMDCKNALKETDGDIEKAVDYLRKKGIASAQKRAGKATNEGAVVSYIHPGNRLGVLIEINCETDFVAKTEDFLQIARNIAMHVAATNPAAITREEIDQDALDKEKEIFKTQVIESGKPENVVDKIVEGKIEKYYQENVLLEQSYVKDPSHTVEEYLLEVSGKLG
ncbi:translation elongation factor Ts, partial [bacterium]|nr:translation elongation factor Ts [bacterium]